MRSTWQFNGRYAAGLLNTRNFVQACGDARSSTRSVRSGSRSGWWLRRGRRCGGRCHARACGVDPAGTHDLFQAPVILADRRADQQGTAKARLDMRTRAAEAIVKLDVAQSGIHVVSHHERDRVFAQMRAFRLAGRPLHLTGDLSQMDGLAFGGLGFRLILRLGLAGPLGKGWRADSSGECSKQHER